MPSFVLETYTAKSPKLIGTLSVSYSRYYRYFRSSCFILFWCSTVVAVGFLPAVWEPTPPVILWYCDLSCKTVGQADGTSNSASHLPLASSGFRGERCQGREIWGRRSWNARGHAGHDMQIEKVEKTRWRCTTAFYFLHFSTVLSVAIGDLFPTEKCCKPQRDEPTLSGSWRGGDASPGPKSWRMPSWTGMEWFIPKIPSVWAKTKQV
jgi:hypothetical protein